MPTPSTLPGRLERLAHRLLPRAASHLARLPAGLAVRLSGAPVHRRDGLTLDPHVQLLRRLRKLTGATLRDDVNLGRARRQLDLDARLAGGVPVPVGAARDIRVPGAAGDLPARLYVPPHAKASGLPLLVFFHGGGFALGSLDSHDAPCRYLCAHGRTLVLSVDYRLSPEHPYPAGLDDATAATRWALDHAAELGADAGLVGVGGDSAGGGFTAAVCQRLAAAGGPQPIAQMLIYPTLDHGTHTPSRDLFGTEYFLDNADRDWFYARYTDNSGFDFHDLGVSPGRIDDEAIRRLPPALVVTAGFDVLRDEGEIYARRLQQAGVRTDLYRAEPMVHGFINMVGLVPGARRAMDEMLVRWKKLGALGG